MCLGVDGCLPRKGSHFPLKDVATNASEMMRVVFDMKSATVDRPLTGASEEHF